MFLFLNWELFRGFQEQQFQQDLVEFEQEKQVAVTREKSTPEKVGQIYFNKDYNIFFSYP